MRRKRTQPTPALPKPVTASDVRQRWVDEANGLPRETRQRFLDLLWGGMTLGAAREELGITFDAAMGIVELNIEKQETLTLRREAV